MADLRCQRCGGPLTATRGQRIILPSVTITVEEDPDQLGYIGKATRVNDGGWCGRCIEEMDEIVGGAV
jgi:hypothetical protein